MALGSSINLSGFRLTFDDEFNSFSSNGPSNYLVTGGTGTWDTTYSYGERKLNDEHELYSDPTTGINPFSVSSGVLDIQAAPSTDLSKTWNQPYSSGVITTYHSFSQEYGYFEMRAELPQGAGMWPAFWMLPVQHEWPPELDPLEAFGATSPDGEGGAYSFHNGLVTSDPNGYGGWNSTNGANLYTQYNTFGVDWEPDTITYYFNGHAYASVPTPSDFHQPMYLIANLAVGGNWPGPTVAETANLKIDYIRAFASTGSNPAVVQQDISSPDGRGYDFYGATDANGQAALGGVDAPAPAPTAPAVVGPAPAGPQTLGAGQDDLVLLMSEDAYQGDAQFILTVDGVQVGATLSTSASHAAGATQSFDVKGSFGAGAHSVYVSFTNDYWGGSAATDRNLYVVGASIDGLAIPSGVLTELGGGPQGFAFTLAASAPGAALTLVGPANQSPVTPTPTPVPTPAPAPSAVTLGTGTDTLALFFSEDFWQVDVRFTVSVDGVAIGGVQTTTASHAGGQTQEFDVKGDFAPGTHQVAVDYLNDAWGGSAATDRNLYLASGTLDGTTVPGAVLAMIVGGTQGFSFIVPPAPDPNADPLVDPVFYAAETGQAGLTADQATAQYDNGGWQAGLDPDAWFDTRYYLAANPDVRAAGVNPLQHYEAYGWHEARNPSSQFDTRLYQAANPAAAGTDPLVQFVQGGQAAGAQAIAVPGAVDPLVDPVFYAAETGQTGLTATEATAQYDNGGWQAGLNPDAWFDTKYYLAANPDVRAAGVNPLLHYEAYGWREGRDPSAAFDTRLYEAANPTIATVSVTAGAATSADPLLRFIQTGQSAGAQAIAVPDAVDPLVDPVFYAAETGQTGLTAAEATAQYDNGGWQRGLDPDAWFDTRYYLAANPDVRAAGVNPLQHYEAYGWLEERNPSGQFDTQLYQAADPAAAGTDPLVQFVQGGQAQGAPAGTQAIAVPGAVDPLVDPVFYEAQTGQTGLSAAAATAQYDNGGWQAGLDPDAWFDTKYYLGNNPDVRAAGVNPLLHYETYGWHEGRDPSAAFSGNQYLAAHTAVAGDPLLQYMQSGRQAGLAIFASPTNGFG